MYKIVISGVVLVTACGTSDRSRLILQGLEAQLLVRGGACNSLNSVDTIRYPRFSTTTFVRGRCVGEHGDTLAAVVALDQDDVIYILDSEGSYTFLLRRHPVEVDSSGAVSYLSQVLPFMGQTHLHDEPVVTGEDLPEDLRDSLGILTQDTLSYVRASSAQLWDAWVTVMRGGHSALMGRFLLGANGVITTLSPMTRLQPATKE